MTDEQRDQAGQAEGPGDPPIDREVDSVQSPSDFLQDSGKYFCGWFTHEAWHDVRGESGCPYGDMCHWFGLYEVSPGIRRLFTDPLTCRCIHRLEFE